MLGDFVNRILLLLLGYAYPAFECFKAVEKNKVDIEELRFWCQYWILVALITSFERVGDIFISWLPLYGEMKLMFFVYLWSSKTKGTGYVYGTLLRPYVAKHETEIDRKIMEMKARAWDIFFYYWQNCTQVGQSTLTQVFQYVLTQSVRLSNPANQKAVQESTNMEPETQQAQPEPKPVNRRLSSLQSTDSQQRRPPTSATDSSRASDVNGEDSDTIPGSPLTEARSRLRRTKVPAAAA